MEQAGPSDCCLIINRWCRRHSACVTAHSRHF